MNLYDFDVKADLSSTVNFICEALDEMGYRKEFGTYEEWTTITVSRGSKMATLFLGPLAGKKNIDVCFGIMCRENAEGNTEVGIGDMKSGFSKLMTLTGGATKKVLSEVHDNLIKLFLNKGMLVT